MAKNKTYVVKLARASGDKKKIYDVKLRLPTELARRLGLKHSTRVVIKPTRPGFMVQKKRIRRGSGAKPQTSANPV